MNKSPNAVDNYELEVNVLKARLAFYIKVKYRLFYYGDGWQGNELSNDVIIIRWHGAENVLQLDIKLRESYLTATHQKVVIRGDESETIPVISGVPQGSVLGPLLSLVYIDDVTTIPSSVGTNWCWMQTMCCSTGRMNTMQRTTQHC